MFESSIMFTFLNIENRVALRCHLHLDNKLNCWTTDGRRAWFPYPGAKLLNLFNKVAIVWKRSINKLYILCCDRLPAEKSKQRLCDAAMGCWDQGCELIMRTSKIYKTQLTSSFQWIFACKSTFFSFFFFYTFWMNPS